MLSNIKKSKNIFSKILLASLLLPIMTINADNHSSVEEEAAKIRFEKRYEDQLNNFVFLIRYVTMPEQSMIHSTASGMIISSTKSHVFVLTAQHFCEAEEDLIFPKEIGIFNGDNIRLGQVIHTDKNSDLCLISGIKYKGEKFKNLKLAKKMPPVGNFVFNVAAPNGMGSPKTRLLFTGHFGGCEDVCVYTVPATFGSSGSGVFNSKGELISVLVMATEDFENVGIGPDIYAINEFLKSIEDMMDIK